MILNCIPVSPHLNSLGFINTGLTLYMLSDYNKVARKDSDKEQLPGEVLSSGFGAVDPGAQRAPLA